MAARNAAKPTPARARRQTTQTIEQIEARAAEIVEAERTAMRELAAFLRNRAVELPVESKLPLRFAESAQTLDLFERPGGNLMAAGYSCAMDQMVQDSASALEAAGLRGVLQAIEQVPPETVGGRAMNALVVYLQHRIDSLEV